MKILETIKKGFVTYKSEICLGTGIGLILTGVVAACKGSYKIPDILEEHLTLKEEIMDAAEKDATVDVRGETWRLYGYTGCKIVKELVLSGISIAGGISLIGYAFSLKDLKIQELEEKNAALAASLATNIAAFNKYRGFVRNELGEEADKRFYDGAKEVEVEETDEKGKAKKTKVTVEDSCDPFVRYITVTNPIFDDDEEMMEFTVRRQMMTLNDRLHARRHDGKPNHVTFNEALSEFAMDGCKEGMVAGWVDGPDAVIEITCEQKNKIGERGQLEKVYKLTFNCSPDIYSKMI